MATHNRLGQNGEECAARFLEQKGYAILHRNWRMEHYEIDIVARQGGTLVFVEVKTRTQRDYGAPYEAVTPAKMRRIVCAADAYINAFELDMPVRFDVLSLLPAAGGAFEIEHFEEAFGPGVE